MFKYILPLITCLILNTNSFAFANAYTLEESLEAAFAFNPQITDAREASSMAEHQIREAEAGYYPTIGIWASAGIAQEESSYARQTFAYSEVTPTSQIGASISQVIWDGGRVKSNVEMLESMHESSVYGVIDTATSIAFSTLSMHIDIIRREELLERSAQNVKALKRIVNLLQRRHNEGALSRGELEQGTLRYNNAEALHLVYLNALSEAKTSYKRLTGQEAPVNLQKVGNPRTVYASIEEICESALLNSPSLHMVASQLEATRNEKEMSKSNSSPVFTLDAGPSYKTRDTGDNTDIFAWNATLNMQWDIYTGGANTANYKAASAKERQYRSKQLATKDSLFEQIAHSYERTQTAMRQYPLYKNARKSGEIALANFYEQFEVGQKDLLNLLDMENEYFTAQVNTILSETDAIIGQYRLHALAGTLLDVLNIDFVEFNKMKSQQ